MRIRIWHSYSCNNSSSYRLVARFGDPANAREAASELTTFLTEHAQQVDAAMESGGSWEDPSEAATTLAQKYGFEWTEIFYWGDDRLASDLPYVAAEGNVLALYHTYCNGFPKEVEVYLTARGATEIERQSCYAPLASMIFRIPSDEVRDELTKLFSSPRKIADTYWIEITPPWSEHEQQGDGAFFCDGETIGMCFPFDPKDHAALRRWLSEHGIENPSIRLCEYGDLEKFDTITAARCNACQGTLKYLDPRIHKIETEQLACAACGGMFELTSFPAVKKRRAE